LPSRGSGGSGAGTKARHGSSTACQALRQYFTHAQAAAPARAAAFLQGTVEEQRRIRADLVSVAQFLLGVRGGVFDTARAVDESLPTAIPQSGCTCHAIIHSPTD